MKGVCLFHFVLLYIFNCFLHPRENLPSTEITFTVAKLILTDIQENILYGS